jgi:hypothetical protein
VVRRRLFPPTLLCTIAFAENFSNVIFGAFLISQSSPCPFYFCLSDFNYN